MQNEISVLSGRLDKDRDYLIRRLELSSDQMFSSVV